MAIRSWPTRGEADNDRGHHRPFSAIGSSRAHVHRGPELFETPFRGRRYDCCQFLRRALGDLGLAGGVQICS